MVTHYSAKGKGVKANRLLKESEIKEYVPSDKKYDDFLFKLRVKINYFLEALREVVAIGWYRVKGKA